MGDPSTAAYVILQGRVELERDGTVSSVLLAGDIFGELSAIHGTRRPGRAVVTEPVVALVLGADAMLAADRRPDARELTP
ncbi:MAG: cyclic nucleotide-binding domain-containing protein [Acidobacteriota bacterium]|nr:cyclic nucleotide-binding domain-containing protein [Acidobacteriota bacterium]